MKLTPTEEELFERYNPDLQKKSLENRGRREQEFDDFVSTIKEAAKSDKHSALSRPTHAVTEADGKSSLDIAEGDGGAEEGSGQVPAATGHRGRQGEAAADEVGCWPPAGGVRAIVSTGCRLLLTLSHSLVPATSRVTISIVLRGGGKLCTIMGRRYWVGVAGLSGRTYLQGLNAMMGSACMISTLSWTKCIKAVSVSCVIFPTNLSGRDQHSDRQL